MRVFACMLCCGVCVCTCGVGRCVFVCCARACVCITCVFCGIECVRARVCICTCSVVLVNVMHVCACALMLLRCASLCACMHMAEIRKRKTFGCWEDQINQLHRYIAEKSDNCHRPLH